ncbi:MAG TPA: DUF11 domain-containing protein, partial [Rhizobiales bacterium]|nr:DUF11 domain-containing protein [Hyphomicrobiales bacterium]
MLPLILSATDHADMSGYRAGTVLRRLRAPFVLFSLLFLATLMPAQAQAQQGGGLLVSGDGIVTGFSGTVMQNGKKFINTNGASAKILPLPQTPKTGQTENPLAKQEITASETGQVFGVALDSAPQPNIYLSATSAYGLHIVADVSGNGTLEPVTAGQPGAQWMDGQFGPGGGPGSIWKVDGTTGAVTLFATIAGNMAGLGNIAYDPVHFQFFVSDLDTGLIHRLDTNGVLIDTFDHGVDGRPGNGLGAVNDDGAVLDITSPAFDSSNPNSWKMTDIRRRVRGLAYYRNRLYYSVDDGPQIWSVGFRADGSFASDARLEIDAIPGGMPVSDLLFTPQGWMIVAQRGAQTGGTAFDSFHIPDIARVLRYRRDQVLNKWDPVADEYPVGINGDKRKSAGGVALSCDGSLWITGDALRNDAAAVATLGGGMLAVHGLEGLDVNLVKPAPAAASSSVFIDYDGVGGDLQKTGQAGDVAVYRNCPQAPGVPGPNMSQNWPGWQPPGNWTPPPQWTPPPWWPPASPGMGIFKQAAQCIDDPANPGDKLCTYTINLTNWGGAVFTGILHATDTPAPGVQYVPPPGGSIAWLCSQAGGPGTPVDCDSLFPVIMPPGASETLELTMRIPAGSPASAYGNCAMTGPGGVIQDCSPPAAPAGLLPDKRNLGCQIAPGGVRCKIRVTVTNTSPGFYFGPLHALDNVGPGVSFVPPVTNIRAFDNWGCVQAGAGAPVTCDEALAFLAPGATSGAEFDVFIPNGSPPASYSDCASLGLGGGGPNMCVNIAQAPDLKLTKTLTANCAGFINKTCQFDINIRNIGTQNFNGPLTVVDPNGGSLPAGTTLTGVAPAPWSCGPLPAALPSVTCTRPPLVLVPGASTTLHLVMSVPFGGWWLQENCARVLFADATPGNNRDCARLIDPADLKMEKTLKQCTGGAGGKVCEFTLKVTNLGPDPFRGVLTVSDTLPAGTTYAGSSGAGWTCTPGAGTVTCTDPSTQTAPLPAGQSKSVVIRVTIPASETGTVTNCAVVKHDDANRANNRDCAQVTQKPEKPRICPSGTLSYPRGAFVPRGWIIRMKLKDGTRCVVPRQIETPPPPPTLIPPERPQCLRSEREVPSASFARKRGWPVRRVRRGKLAIWCARPIEILPPQCAEGERQVPSASFARKRGWPVRRVRRGKLAIWCARPIEILPPQCAEGERQVPSASFARKRGWPVRRVRRGKLAIWCARPIVNVPIRCGEGERKVPSLRYAQRRGWPARRVSNGRQTIWCARPVAQIRLRCAPGERKVPSLRYAQRR